MVVLFGMSVIRTTNRTFNGVKVSLTKHFLKRYAERMFNVDEKTSKTYIDMQANFNKLCKDISVRLDKCLDVTTEIPPDKLMLFSYKYIGTNMRFYKHNKVVMIADVKKDTYLFLTCYYEK